jgi:hypothetical protein
MLSRSEVQSLRNALAPSMLTAQSSMTGLTEASILTGPVRVYGVTTTVFSGAQTLRFVDGANTEANFKVFLGTQGANAEFYMTWAPGWVRFDTEVRLVTGLASEVEYTVLYTPL